MKPTRTRHLVVVFAVTLAIITYVDRICISQAAPNIRHDLGLTPTQMGWAFSAFGWAYALMEIPSGWLGDWLGPRRVLLRVVLWWSFFTAATGWVWNTLSLVVTRTLFGAGEAGCFPNITKAFTTWLPQHERVRAQGITWMAARWGGAFTPLLVVWVFQFLTWRRSFAFFGAIGVIWAVVFYLWYRDNPRDHRGVNEAELALLQGAEHTASGHGDVPWSKLFRSHTAWALWVQYFCMSYAWYFYISWLPTYLKEYHHLTPEYGAKLAIFPLGFGGIGCVLGGLIAPRLAARLGSVATARRLMGYVGYTAAGVLLLIHTGIRDPFWAMFFMGLSSFGNDLVMPGAWGACMDVGGKYAGTLSGSMNMMGNFGTGVAGIMAGFLLEHTGSWLVNFYAAACIYVVGAIAWRFIDPVTPLEEQVTA